MTMTKITMTSEPICCNCWNKPICKAQVEYCKTVGPVEDEYDVGRFCDGNERHIAWETNPRNCSYFVSITEGRLKKNGLLIHKDWARIRDKEDRELFFGDTIVVEYDLDMLKERYPKLTEDELTREQKQQGKLSRSDSGYYVNRCRLKLELHPTITRITAFYGDD